jgi:Raf kinase inhibitor-like YbhB/YbcL family protein
MRVRALVVGACTLALAACGDDGRVLAPAPPTTSTPAVAPPSTEGALTSLRITSPDVTDGGTFDPRLTCDGDDEAPVLVITGVPEAAVELAVAVVDVDADRVHLVVTNLAPTADVVDPDAPPGGAVLARTDRGVIGWSGPCPSPGEPPHRYEARAYALAEPLGLAEGAAGPDALAALESAAIERATLSATYP